MRLPQTTLDDFLEEVQSQFEQQLKIESLLVLSKQLQAELKQHLISSPQCMLPSYNYTLPTGDEKGTYLALEVGGSNLRMALVELGGRSLGPKSLQIRRTMSFPIDNAVRQSPEYAFFDWMAERIGDMLRLENGRHYLMGETKPLRMGIAWSFPIDQTSIRSGNVLGMGKGFLCSDAVIGDDLGDVICQACRRAGVNVVLAAIVNDSSSTLLARAYLDPATRLAYILGTGTNAAIYLPITSLGPSKFASRSLPNDIGITHVLTNTEFSMYGKNIFPTTRWDGVLNSSHILPNYQPFEYLVAGGYMGEIVRLIIVEATKTAGLFRGSLPPSLTPQYVLDTKLLAQIERDTSDSLATTCTLLHQHHPTNRFPSFNDATFILQTIRFVSRRSIAYLTTGVHALSSLLQDLESKAGLENDLDHISIGCDGSVINKYPGYMDRAQDTLDEMAAIEGLGRKRVILERTQKSAVLGAGVAAAMAANAMAASAA